MNNDEIKKHSRSEGYLEVSKKAYEKYPDSSLDRLEYIRENGTIQDYNIYAICVLKSRICSETIEIYKDEVVNIVKALNVAVDYMEDDLSHDVYEYVKDRIKSVLEK